MTDTTTTPATNTVVQTSDTTVTVPTNDASYTVGGFALPLPSGFPEPALLTGLVSALVLGGLGTLTAFGLDISAELQARIMSGTISAVGVAILVAVIVRQFVVPLGRAKAAIRDAYHAQPGVDPEPVVDDPLSPHAV